MSAYTAAVLADSPISYWRLGEPSGTSAADSAGANTGTYTGGFTLAQTSLLPADADTAVALNGTTGYVTVPDALNLRITGDLTLEAWVKPTDFANYNEIVSKCLVSAPRPYEWRLEQTTGKPTFLGASTTLATTGLTAGAVSYIALTISGTTVTHYLNGSANGTGTDSRATTDGGTALKIGSRDDLNASIFFKGVIDEVAIYNTALSAGRISAHYAAASAAGGVGRGLLGIGV